MHTGIFLRITNPKQSISFTQRPHNDGTTTDSAQIKHSEQAWHAKYGHCIHPLQARHENNISEASYNNDKGNSSKFHSFSFKGNVYENLYRPLVGYVLLYIPLLVYNIHI